MAVSDEQIVDAHVTCSTRRWPTPGSGPPTDDKACTNLTVIFPTDSESQQRFNFILDIFEALSWSYEDVKKGFATVLVRWATSWCGPPPDGTRYFVQPC
jgi:hypothetical protein